LHESGSFRQLALFGSVSAKIGLQYVSLRDVRRFRMSGLQLPVEIGFALSNSGIALDELVRAPPTIRVTDIASKLKFVCLIMIGPANISKPRPVQ
jgi:hypothetical protein